MFLVLTPYWICSLDKFVGYIGSEHEMIEVKTEFGKIVLVTLVK